MGLMPMGWVGGISQADSRIFLQQRVAGRARDNVPVLYKCVVPGAICSNGRSCHLLNLNSRPEVDELYYRRNEAGARILAEPEDKPWRLREFSVGDLDGNEPRVFYEFSWELRQ